VSQGIAVAAGIQDSFSWKAVGLSALSAGFTAGIGAAGILPGANVEAVVGRAMLGNAATQGIATAFGMQPSFNWKGVAAAGVGAAVGQAMGDALNHNLAPGMMGPTQPAFWSLGDAGAVLRGSISGFVGGLAAAGVRGGKVVVQQVAADAFGNALGDSLADAMSSPPPHSAALPQRGAELSTRGQLALDALAVAAQAHGGYDKIPANSAELQLAYGIAQANNNTIFGLAKEGDWGAGFTDSVSLAGAGSWTSDGSTFRRGARDLAIGGGVVAGMFQSVGDTAIGTGVLVKDLLLAQQYMLGGGDNWVNRNVLSGFEIKQEAYNNIQALSASVREIVIDPKRYLGDVVGGSYDHVTKALAQAQRTDDLDDWFFYGAAVGNVTFGVASVVAGAGGVARLATAGTRELNAVLRARIDALAPDVSANPLAPEFSRGSPVPPLRDSPNSPPEPYNRRKHFGNTPTAADRAALGAGPDDVVDHQPPLVKRYYEGDPATGEWPAWQLSDTQRRASGNDRDRMGLQLKSESNAQGAEMSNFSKEMKRRYGW
jgi:hypothetical protein